MLVAKELKYMLKNIFTYVIGAQNCSLIPNIIIKLLKHKGPNVLNPSPWKNTLSTNVYNGCVDT